MGHSRNMSKKKWKFELDEIALGIIVALIVIVVNFYDTGSNLVDMEAEKITALMLDDHDISFASNGIIDEDKLNEIKNMDYHQLMNFINAKNDFCIYIQDGHGNIILAKGSYKLNLSSIGCSE